MRLFLPLMATAIFSLAGSLSQAYADDLQEATRLYRQGNKGDAQTKLSAYLSQNPKDPRGRFLQGVIFTEQKRNAEALKIFTALTEDHPELPEPYNNLAVLHASQGEYEKARRALETSIRTHPSYAVAHENLGDVYATLASQAYDRALQLDGGNSAARTKLALIKELVPKNATTVAQIKTDTEPSTPTGKPEPKVEPKPVKPETAKPEPAKPEPAKPAQPAAHAEADVMKAVQAWARAWSNNDAEQYLAAYAPDFETPNGEPRRQWESARRERIAKPRKIDVTLINPAITLVDDNRASVAFRQHYRSDALSTSGRKKLDMVRKGERWLIQREVIAK